MGGVEGVLQRTRRSNFTDQVTVGRKPRAQLSTIAPPSTPTTTNMGTPFPIPSSSKKRKRPITGGQGKGEGSDRRDPEDLEIRPPSAPPLRVRPDGHPDGQYFSTT